jgi:hypothetical protein
MAGSGLGHIEGVVATEELATESAGYITGAVIPVTGGMDLLNF